MTTSSKITDHKFFLVLVGVVLTSLVILTFSSYSTICSEEVPYAPTVGETVIGLDEEIDGGRYRRTIECYPTEIYDGDTVYISEYLEKLCDEAKPSILEPDMSPIWERDFSVEITSKEINGCYRCRYEKPISYTYCYAFPPPSPYILAKLGKKYCIRRFSVEFCPLQDYEDPFWKELREKTTPQGIHCTMTIRGVLGTDWLGAKEFVYSQDILVKSRPANEAALLEKWYKNTPKLFFPNEGYSCVARFFERGKRDIRLSSSDWRYYDPWLFIPVGYRKPSIPNNPRSLKGWRKLEASLVPSTLRDEIRLTRLRLEYFAAKDENAAAEAKKTYSDWLESLPLSQRNVMSSYDYYSYQRHGWNFESNVDLIGNIRFGDRFLELEVERFGDLKEAIDDWRVYRRTNPSTLLSFIEKKKKKFSRVVIFGVGGVGTLFSKAKVRNIEKIFSDGSGCRKVVSFPANAAECWTSILHGVTPTYHERTKRDVESTPYPEDSPFPSIFRVIHENRPDANLASFCTWNPINTGVIEDNIGVVKETANSDLALTDRVCEYVEKNDPTLLFVEFDECDQVGTEKGYGSSEQLEQITKTDDYIRRIYDVFEKRGLLESTLFILMTERGEKVKYPQLHISAGGNVDYKNDLSVVVATSAYASLSISSVEIRDVASMVLNALDLADKQPEGWTSLAPQSVFSGGTCGERPVYEIPYAYDYRRRCDDSSKESPSPNVVDLLGAERVVCHLPFDSEFYKIGTRENIRLNGDFSIFPKKGFLNGAAEFFMEGVSCEVPKSCEDGFSVALWVKTGYVGGEPQIISNKSWDDPSKVGFAATLRPPYIKFKVGSENDERALKEFKLPKDYREGWVYVVLVVDRREGALRLSYDFEDFTTVKLDPEVLKDSDFTLSPLIAVGKDNVEDSVNAGLLFDEFVLVDGSLTREDLDKLKIYYTEETALKEE